MAGVERKLTTIVAVDAEGFSKLMGADEAGTLAALKACRAIMDAIITEHQGRIFGGAGDSLIAEFASPVQAVIAANEFQRRIAERNDHPDTPLAMRFRVGINMGDVIIEGENLYGDGVNVASRLEGVAVPGGVCIAAKVYEEVRRKLDLGFAFGGMQQLKNIDEPIGIYCLNTPDDPRKPDDPRHPRGPCGPAGVNTAGAGAASAALPAARRAMRETPLVVFHPIKVISGDDEVVDLAAGLSEDLHAGLVNVKAIQVALGEGAGVTGAGDAALPGEAPDFVLEGSIRASGQRLRLSFTLADVGAGKQAWSERFDRTVDDVFDLQDEISRSVVFSVRLHVKEQVFQRLKSTDNDALSTPELLDKAAGYFVSGYGDNAAAEATLRVAISREPDNSMALGMLAACLHRLAEYSAAAIPPDRVAEIRDLAARAVALAPQSYYARYIDSVVRFDIDGNVDSARGQAESVLELNAEMLPAIGMVALCRMHGGEVDEGLAKLAEVVDATRGDPHRPRHMREIALGYFIKGDYATAARHATRLVDAVPELRRNWAVNAALQQAAGNEAAAQAQMARLLAAEPGLNLTNTRPLFIGNADAADRFNEALLAAGLPAS